MWIFTGLIVKLINAYESFISPWYTNRIKLSLFLYFCTQTIGERLLKVVYQISMSTDFLLLWHSANACYKSFKKTLKFPLKSPPLYFFRCVCVCVFYIPLSVRPFVHNTLTVNVLKFIFWLDHVYFEGRKSIRVISLWIPTLPAKVYHVLICILSLNHCVWRTTSV